MKLSIKRLWHEPLVHFLLIGVALFVFYDLTRDGGSEAPNRIVVSSGEVEQLSANFKRTWMRRPTESELSGLIENRVRDEVFYREALAMGLDQNDPLVRRRMRMKLEFILEDLSAQDVTDAQLTAFMQKNADQFRMQPQVSFQQVYLNPDKHPNLVSDAEQSLLRLNGGAAPELVGDPTMVPYEYSMAAQSEIARSFGERFASEVVKLEPGEWIGPVYSPFGGHLLKVTQRAGARMPELAEIRPIVEREYLAQRRKEQKDLAYAKLREGYEVIIEPSETAQTAAGGALAAARTDKANR